MAAGLIAANVFVYAGVWRYDFVNIDDPDYLIKNPNIADGLTRHAVSWAFRTGHVANWHPVTWLSHMLDVQLYGMSPGPHHLTNLLFHIVNTLLLFGLLRQMTGALGRSAVVAGLFAVHPLHVESVAWLSERKDVLSTLFWLLTLWAYLQFVRQRRLGRYLVMLIFFALGLMAKPMLVTLPFLLLLLDVWPLRRAPFGQDFLDRTVPDHPTERRAIWLQLILEKVPLLALSLASSIVTFLVQQRGGAVSAVPVGVRVANATVSYVSYIGKMLWPTHLAVLYPYPESAPRWSAILSSLSLVAISFLAARAARHRPYVPVGWLWFLGTLVPAIGLVQVGHQAMADRYTYVPLIGLFIVVAWGSVELLAFWRPGKIVLAVSASVVMLALMITARTQVGYWANSVTLWGHTLEVTTENSVAHSSIGIALWDEGNIDEATAHFVEAARLKPGDGAIHNNLAVALAKQGRLDEAVREYTEAVRINPTQPDWHYNLAVSLNRRGDVAQAVHHLELAVGLDPMHAKARQMLHRLSNRGGGSEGGIP